MKRAQTSEKSAKPRAVDPLKGLRARPMMHPKYERVRLLDAAIAAAVDQMDMPIERIELTGGRIVISGGGERVVLRPDYQNGRNENGEILLGGGQWSVHPVEGEKPVVRQGFWRRWFG
jgi:hypothetical protein